MVLVLRERPVGIDLVDSHLPELGLQRAMKASASGEAGGEAAGTIGAEPEKSVGLLMGGSLPAGGGGWKRAAAPNHPPPGATALRIASAARSLMLRRLMAARKARSRWRSGVSRN